MKTNGIVFDLKKYAIHDGPGIRSTVFFKGCSLCCWWCHNPESQKSAPETIVKIKRRKCLNLSYSETRDVIGRDVSLEEIMQEIEKDVVFYDQSGGGITFSGGEPLMQPDFLYSLLTECKSKGIHTAVDTSGHAPWTIFDRIYDKVDLFLYDLKIMDEEEHRKYTGGGNKRILENLKRLTRRGGNIFIRVPVIPDITDTTENITRLAEFIFSLENIRRVDLLPYNRIGKEKYKRLNRTYQLENLRPPSNEKMKEIKNKFKAFGFEVKIRG